MCIVKITSVSPILTQYTHIINFSLSVQFNDYFVFTLYFCVMSLIYRQTFFQYLCQVFCSEFPWGQSGHSFLDM